MYTKNLILILLFYSVISCNKDDSNVKIDCSFLNKRNITTEPRAYCLQYKINGISPCTDECNMENWHFIIQNSENWNKVNWLVDHSFGNWYDLTIPPPCNTPFNIYFSASFGGLYSNIYSSLILDMEFRTNTFNYSCQNNNYRKFRILVYPLYSCDEADLSDVLVGRMQIDLNPLTDDCTFNSLITTPCTILNPVCPNSNTGTGN